MKKILSKTRYYLMGLGVIALLVLAVILKNNKVEELISKLRMGRVDREEEKINIAIDSAKRKGELKKKEIDEMTLEDRADFYNKRYK